MANSIPTYGIIQKHKCRGINTWYGWCRRNGKFKFTSLRTESKKEAKQWLDRMNAARFFENVKIWGFSSIDKIDPDKEIEAYIKIPRAENSSITTSNSLKHFSRFLDKEGIDDLNDFSSDNADSYVQFLYDEGVKPKNFVATAKSMLSKAWRRHGKTDVSPFEDVKLAKEEKKEKTSWNPEEIKAILENAESSEMRMLWALMAYAGLRIHEALKFTNEDIKDGCFYVLGKGKKQATLPIGKTLQSEFDRYKGTFPIQFKRRTVHRELTKACKAAGVKEGSSHSFRHSFCSNMARLGINAKYAQELMRHATSAMTLDVYSHVVPEDLKKVASQI